MDDALAWAQQLYARNKFDLALQVLENRSCQRADCLVDRTSPAQKSKLFRFYELRSSLYYRRGQFTDSSQDAVLMIKLCPHDGKGYLRLGQLYYARHLYKRAQANYSKGLSQVSKESPCYAVLERMYHKATLKACAPREKRKDPVAILPKDVLYIIFDLVTTKFEARARLCSVSKSWRDYLQCETRFWKNITVLKNPVAIKWTTLEYFSSLTHGDINLDLSKALVKPNHSSMTRFFRLCGPKFSALNLLNSLKSCSIPTLDFFRLHTLCLSLLKHLSVVSHQGRADIVWALENLKSLESIHVLVMGCGNDAYPQFSQIVSSKLRRVVIESLADQDCLESVSVHLLSAYEGLEELKLQRVTSDIDVVSTAAQNQSLTSFGFTTLTPRYGEITLSLPMFQGQMRRLTLNHICLSTFDGPNQKLPLVYLELRFSVLADPLSLSDLIRHYDCQDSLESLVIHQTKLSLPREPLGLDSVRELQYTRMSEIDDPTMDWILSSMPNLESIDLDDSKISGSTLAKVLFHPRIRAVRCKGCPMSMQTLEWVKRSSKTIVY